MEIDLSITIGSWDPSHSTSGKLPSPGAEAWSRTGGMLDPDLRGTHEWGMLEKEEWGLLDVHPGHDAPTAVPRPSGYETSCSAAIVATSKAVVMEGKKP